MPVPLGFDSFAFRCARCSATFAAPDAVPLHQAAHDIADGLLAAPGLRDQVLKLLGLTD